MQPTLRAGEWKVTVAVHRGQVITAIWPGFHDRSFGLAVDVGSTTIAAHLCDLHSGEVIASSGLMNPQIRFGEDLMSRVSYVMMNPGGETEMTRVVREAEVVDDPPRSGVVTFTGKVVLVINKGADSKGNLKGTTPWRMAALESSSTS